MSRAYLDPEPEDLARCVNSWMSYCSRSGVIFAQPARGSSRAYFDNQGRYIVELCRDDEPFAAFLVTPERVKRLEEVPA